MFSKATEYALRATIFIAQRSTEETKLSIDDISLSQKKQKKILSDLY